MLAHQSLSPWLRLSVDKGAIFRRTCGRLIAHSPPIKELRVTPDEIVSPANSFRHGRQGNRPN